MGSINHHRVTHQQRAHLNPFHYPAVLEQHPCPRGVQCHASHALHNPPQVVNDPRAPQTVEEFLKDTDANLRHLLQTLS